MTEQQPEDFSVVARYAPDHPYTRGLIDVVLVRQKKEELVSRTIAWPGDAMAEAVPKLVERMGVSGDFAKSVVRIAWGTPDTPVSVSVRKGVRDQ